MGERARHRSHQAILFIMREVARNHFTVFEPLNLSARVALNLPEVFRLRENLGQDFEFAVNGSLTQTHSPDGDRIAPNCFEALNHFRSDLIQPFVSEVLDQSLAARLIRCPARTFIRARPGKVNRLNEFTESRHYLLVRAVFALEDIILDPNLGLLGLELSASLFNRAEITDVVDPKIVVPVGVLAGSLFPTLTPLTRTLKN
jgi:hypothetical protein